MTQYFRSLFDVRRHELAQMIPLFFNYFLLILTSYILKSASSALFLNKVGVGKLPYTYILIAVAAACVAFLLGRFSGRVSVVRLITITQWFLVGNMILLWSLLRFTDWTWPYYGFLVWMKIFSILTVSQFWVFANNCLDSRQAKRLFGLLNLGGVVGAMLGGTFTMLFVRILMAENLILCAAATMVLAIVIFWQASRRMPVTRESSRGSESHHPLDILRLVVKSRHLMVISAIISISVVVGKLVEYQFFGFAQSTFPDKEDLTAFLGAFMGLYLNAVTFSVQLFLTGAVLRVMGVGGALRFTPVAVIIASLGVLAFPGIWLVSGLRMIQAGCRYTLNKTSLEVLYLPIPPEVKNRTKVFLDMVVDRVSGGLAGLILVFCTSVLLLNLRQLGIVTVIFAGLWIFLAGFALHAYVRTLRSSLEKREVHFESVTVNVSDAATLKLLTQALDSPNTRQVSYALKLFEQFPATFPKDRLPRLLKHPAAEVRAATLRVLSGRGDRSAVAEAEQFLGADDPGLLAESVNYLSRLDPDPDSRLQSFLSHKNLDIRLAALEALEANAYEKPVATISESWIEALLVPDRTETEKARVLAARALPLADRASIAGPLRQLLEDSNATVVNAALETAGKVRNRKLVSLVLSKLANRRTRARARDALASYGPRILGTLGDYLQDTGEPENIRRAIPRLLGQIATLEAAGILVENLKNSSFEMRFQILKALNRLRRDHPEVPIPGDPVEREIVGEMKRYYQCLFNVQSSKADEGPSRLLLIRTLEERLDQTLERVFRLLGLRYSPEGVFDAYQAVRSPRAQRRAAAVEFLDSTLGRPLKRLILPVLEEIAWDRLRLLGKQQFDLKPAGTADFLKDLIRGDDRWVKMVAIYRAGELRLTSLEPDIRAAVSDPDPKVVETASHALERLATKSGE